MTMERSSSTGSKYTVLKAFSCCALLGFGVLCKLPHDLQDAVMTQTSLLRGGDHGAVIRPIGETMFILPTNETTDYAGFRQDNATDDDSVKKLDFFVSGFPKCGTTTLLRTFEQHAETAMPPNEECALDQEFQDDRAYARLMNSLKNATTNNTTHVKRGIKCPSGLTTPKGIERLEDWFPHARLIFGLRHPVLYFQSFYNYRVLEVHKGKWNVEHIPSPEFVLESDATPWLGLTMERTQFERVLEKLGKTKASQEPKTPFKVFLYTLGQMEDDDDDRRARMRHTLGEFLELKKPIEPLPQANRNGFVGEKGFNETMNICDSKHNVLRGVLVENGKKTQQWILDEFLSSPDVTVANAAHFRALVSEWGTDPCNKNEKKDDSQEAEQ